MAVEGRTKESIPTYAPVITPEDLCQEIPNKFLHQLYLRYPNVVPQVEYPERPQDLVKQKYRHLDNYQTTYQYSYGGGWDGGRPRLVGGAMLEPTEDNSPRRLPGLTYLQRVTDKITQQPPPRILPLPPPLGDLKKGHAKCGSEYQSDINVVGKFILKHKIYTQPVLVEPRIVKVYE